MVGGSGAPRPLLPAVTGYQAGIKATLSLLFAEGVAILEVTHIFEVAGKLFTVVVSYKNHIVVFFGNYLASHIITSSVFQVIPIKLNTPTSSTPLPSMILFRVDVPLL
jgi:hypothetical protein